MEAQEAPRRRPGKGRLLSENLQLADPDLGLTGVVDRDDAGLAASFPLHGWQALRLCYVR